MKDLFRHKVAGFIAENRLFDFSRCIVVALSGGADSVALLRVLLQCGYQCVAAHCNFHLRGDESVRDEAGQHQVHCPAGKGLSGGAVLWL